MEILLNIHMLLWWLADDPRLSSKAGALIADPANALTVNRGNASSEKHAFHDHS